jgi:hypothetical protein
MIQSYKNSLIYLQTSIPEQYDKKDDLERIINSFLLNISYKPPELLSETFRIYCIKIIHFLPLENKEWALEPWNNILNVAKNNNKLLEENNI